MKSIERVRNISIKILISLIVISFQASLPALAGNGPSGKITVAIPSNINSLSPAYNPGWIGQACNWQIFDALVTRDPETLQIVPQLAKSWKMINDTTWEFDLRRDVKFHNGEPFNAETVFWNFEKMLDKSLNMPSRGLIASLVKKVEVIDEYKIRIITPTPQPILLEALVMVFLMPPKYLEKVGWEVSGQKPIGTGPYKFVSWVKGQRLVLEANENYWKFKPAVKTIVIRPIPETATQIAELLSGGVDLIFNVPPDQISIIKRSDNARVVTGPAIRTVYVLFDAMGRAGNSAIQNPKVREAISHAIHVEPIIEHVLGGLATRAETGLNPNVFGADRNIKAPEYSLQKAEKLLAEAGYPDGFTMTLNSYAGSITSADQVMLAIAGQLAKVNIKVKTRFLEDAGSFTKAMIAGKLEDAILHSWGYGGMFDAHMFYIYLFRKGSRWSYVDNENLHKLVVGAGSTVDFEKRREYYGEAQQIIKSNTYLVPMYAQNFIIGVSNRISYKHSTDERVRLFDITWRN